MTPNADVADQRRRARPAARLHAAACILLAVTAVPLRPSQEPDKPAAENWPEGLRIETWIDPEHATVGDHIRVDFLIALPEGCQVRMPDPGRHIGDLSVLQFYPGPDLPEDPQGPDTEPAETAQRRHAARLIVAAYRTGSLELPPLRLVFTDRTGSVTELATPALHITIDSVLTEQDPQLRDLRKQAEIPMPMRWGLWLAAAAILAAAVALWLYFRRRRARPPLPIHAPQEDPLDLAEAELRDLIRRGLIEAGLVKQFYVALSEVVRKIIEAGYDISTLEKTTSEISEELRAVRDGQPPDFNPDRIETFLLSCDMVKFARYVPSPDENQAAVRDALAILEECRKRRVSAPVTELGAVSGAP